MRPLLLFSFLASVVAGQPNATVPAEGASFSGTVVSAKTGEPLRKATLHFRSGALDYVATSDARGAFAFENIRFGATAYALVVTRYGYLERTYFPNEIAVEPNRERKNLLLKLTPQAVISGHIYDEDGDPLPMSGVKLIPVSRLARGRHSSQSTNGEVNSEGYFVFTGLKAGRYYVAGYIQNGLGDPARRADRTPEEHYATTYYPNAIEQADATPVDVAAGGQVRNIEILLQKTRSFRVRGKVANSTGNPAPTEVVLSLETGDQYSENLRVASVRDGAFEFTAVKPGSYLIRTRQVEVEEQPDTAVFSRQPVMVTNQDVEDVSVELTRGTEVEGTVRLENAGPGPPPRVYVSFESIDLAANSRTVRTADDGKFQIRKLPPAYYRTTVSAFVQGLYVKSIRCAGKDVTNSPVDLTSQALETMEIVVALSAGSIRASVVDAKGQPVRATITLWSEASRSALEYGPPSGEIRVSNLAPGEYYVAAASLDEVLRPWSARC